MTFTHDDSNGKLQISGMLQILEAEELRETLSQFVLNHAQIEVDLSAVEGCDTAALQVLLAGQRTSASLGKSFRFVSISEAVVKSADGIGLSLPSDAPKGMIAQ